MFEDADGNKWELDIPETYKYPTKPKYNKIERLDIETPGFAKQAMNMCLNSLKTYGQVARELNKIYNLSEDKKINRLDLHNFIKSNQQAIIEIEEQKKALSKNRAELMIDSNETIMKGLNELEAAKNMVKRITKTLEDDEVPITYKVAEVTKLNKSLIASINTQKDLLLAHARLNGKLKDEKGDMNVQTNVQVNVLNKDNSELAQRLAKAEFSNKVVDVKDETNNPNSRKVS